MKKKLSVKAWVLLALSAVLFCMAIGAFMEDGGDIMDAYAEEAATEEGNRVSEGESSTAGENGGLSKENTITEESSMVSEEDATTKENSGASGEDATITESSGVPGEGDATTEGSAEAREEGSERPVESEYSDNEEEADSKAESETEGGTVPEDEIPKSECTCKEKCAQYSIDKECGACKEDYTRCGYMNPNVKITIFTPSGWHKNTTKVDISVEDVAHSGNFAIKTVQAKIAQNGSWTDITEDMYAEVSENVTVYVLVTDQKGKTYERNRYIKCFDFTKPTLNAAVSDGLLSIQAHDTDSGIKAVYVNGYEFTELTNGVLNIRLQQFDAGYQYFTIAAMDNVGNMSEIYKTANPYYTDPAKGESSEKNPSGQLPANAQATKPSSATAQVTEHTKTDSDGNAVSSNSPADQEKQGIAESAAPEKEESPSDSEKNQKGKEFYTIQTESAKKFYLIIDRDGEQERVYFLTEVTENDLLNVTADNSQTLPKNSAALESAIPVTESALPNNNSGTKTGEEPAEKTTEEGSEEPTGETMEEDNGKPTGETTEEGSGEPVKEAEPKPDKENPIATYIIYGIVAVAAIGGGYYFKIVKKKKEGFLDEDDDEEDSEGEYEDDEEEDSDGEEDFFKDDGEE